MRLPIDPRAWPGTLILLAFICGLWLISKPAALVILMLGVGHLAFFRDPSRRAPEGKGLVSPADGTIVDISSFFDERYLKEEAIKIGIFLSIFVPHVTRIPMAGNVGYQKYEPGKFLNALRADSAEKNESNWIGIEQEGKRVLIRQITGAIARRIYWDVKINQPLQRGDKVGIICYGSRVESFFPKRWFRPLVKVGDKVKAGETVLGEWLS